MYITSVQKTQPYSRKNQQLLRKLCEHNLKSSCIVSPPVLASAVDTVMGSSAMVTVLRQEIDRYNTLLHGIHSSMRSLVLAIKGEIIMSEPLEDAYNALLAQKVPQKWKVGHWSYWGTHCASYSHRKSCTLFSASCLCFLNAIPYEYSVCFGHRKNVSI